MANGYLGVRWHESCNKPQPVVQPQGLHASADERSSQPGGLVRLFKTRLTGLMPWAFVSIAHHPS